MNPDVWEEIFQDMDRPLSYNDDECLHTYMYGIVEALSWTHIPDSW